jgi:splicing factor 3A subunit 1
MPEFESAVGFEMMADTAEPLIVIPPPEIRKVLDKTAHFVARNGPSFEERIKENEKMNNKFAFLNQNDPYRPYYDKRVKEFKEGTGEI